MRRKLLLSVCASVLANNVFANTGVGISIVGNTNLINKKSAT